MRFGACLWCVLVSGRAAAQDTGAVENDLCPPYDGALFEAAELLPSLGGSSTLSLAAGDVDADGLNEVVAAMGGTSPGIVVHHRSVVDGTWTSDLTSHAFALRDIELGDVDDDGDLDVLGWGCAGPYLFDNVAGTIAPPIDLVLMTGCGGHAAIDFDGDGDLDLVTVFDAPSYIGEFGIGVLAYYLYAHENVGGGLFSDFGFGGETFGGYSLTDGDVDGDGDEDLVVHGRDWSLDPDPGPGYFDAEELEVYENTSGPDGLVFSFREEPELPNDDQLLLADLDGDGIQDLVVTSCEEDSVRWLVGLGGSFGDEADITTSIDCPEIPRATDIDLDDDLDLILGGPSGGLWVENAGNGVWEEPIPVVADRDVVALTTSDLNMDGDLSPDLVFGFDTSDVVEVYLNQTPVCIVPCQCGVGPGASTPWLLLVASAFLVHRRSASRAARARSTS